MAPSNDKREARARRNTILRRSRGLVKKASELAILADSKLCLIIDFPEHMAMAPMTWPESHAEVEQVIRQYRDPSRGKKKKNKKKGKNKIEGPAADNGIALPGAAAAPAKAPDVPDPGGRRALRLPCPDSRFGLLLLMEELDKTLEKVRSSIKSAPSSSTSSFQAPAAFLKIPPLSGCHGGALVEAPTPISWMPPMSSVHGSIPVEAPTPIRWMPHEYPFGREIGGDEATHGTGEATDDSAMF